jgi:endonuclease G
MKRSQRIRDERRILSLRAFERWKGFQPVSAAIRGAEANRDGTIARPMVGAITPEQRVRYEERQRLRAAFDSPAYRNLRIATERQIGATLDFADLPPNQQASKAGRPVVRLVTLPGGGMVPQGFATGFLVAPDLLLTNHHVFRTRDEAEGVGAQFLYERTPEGLREGIIFELDPARFFVNDRLLDYAVVAVRPNALSGLPLKDFQHLPLIEAKGKIVKGDPVNIIQHPNGDPKQYATVNNRLLDLRDDGFLLYETDTLEGSSGSPVFNEHWETIGLHHCGVPQMENGLFVMRDGKRVPAIEEVADSDLVWIANEGVRVSAIVASLRNQRFDRREQQTILKMLLDLTQDPLRKVAELGPGTGAGVSLVTDPAGATMAQHVFQFTGPVTIQMNTAVSNGQVYEPRPGPDLPPPPEQEFAEKTLKFDEDYKQRDKHGYEPTFLKGWNIPVPTVIAKRAGELVKNGGSKPWTIPYYHYSLTMNRKRRLLMWAASNVDYSVDARKFTKTRKEYGGENWRLDPRVALDQPGLQIEDAHFYKPATKIDRGHIVRREDGAWGKSTKEAEFGNSDTYHWTNCTPQSEAFNQSGKDGIWGQFEEHIQSEVKAEGGRMNVFAGPVLNPKDPEHGYANGSTIQVPMEFWKVVTCVSKENGKAVKRAYGFVFDQTEAIERLGYERMNMDDYKIYQMPIPDISKKTGVVFHASVINADVLKGAPGTESVRGFETKQITSLESVVLR